MICRAARVRRPSVWTPEFGGAELASCAMHGATDNAGNSSQYASGQLGPPGGSCQITSGIVGRGRRSDELTPSRHEVKPANDHLRGLCLLRRHLSSIMISPDHPPLYSALTVEVGPLPRHCSLGLPEAYRRRACCCIAEAYRRPRARYHVTHFRC